MPNKRQGVRAIKSLVEQKVNNTVWFATGEVTAVRKEDRRIRVKIFPEGLETNWIRVFWPLAGQDYGIYVLPEVGTELGLLFLGAEPDFAYAIGCSNDDDDEIPEIDNDYDLIIKPKFGGFIKITKDDGVEINTDKNVVVNCEGKTVVNCDDIHLGDETGSKVLTADSFLPKYNQDMQAIMLHTSYIAPDASLSTIGNATEFAQGCQKVKAK